METPAIRCNSYTNFTQRYTSATKFQGAVKSNITTKTLLRRKAVDASWE